MEKMLKRFEDNFSSEVINGEKHIFLIEPFVDGEYGESYYMVFAYNATNKRVWALHYYFDEVEAQRFNEPSDYIDWSKPDEIILCEDFDVEDFKHQLPKED